MLYINIFYYPCRQLKFSKISQINKNNLDLNRNKIDI